MSNVFTSSDNYPLIMVHGFLGWGNDEFMGLNYWGGLTSLRDCLVKQGYEVYTPTIGSLSSNWDRACELYAYIKGGTVDYGEAHSKKYGHARYGRVYPGVYPQMGTVSQIGEIQKVNLLGHSMGGQTIRLLVQLLEKGSLEETAAVPLTNLSPLFAGGKAWVNSIITIATPHDGTPLTHNQFNVESIVQDFTAVLAAEGGLVDSKDPIFDYRLDQWGLKKEANESYESYFYKVMQSDLWKTSKDISFWDLSPEGAGELNSWVKAQEDIYYFSLACEDTYQCIITNNQIPEINMNAILVPFSYYLGSYTNNNPGDVKIDNTWWKNDGIVSVVSAVCPKIGSTDKMIYYNGNPEKGVWNYLGERKSTDHMAIVGYFKCDQSLIDLYINLAKIMC